MAMTKQQARELLSTITINAPKTAKISVKAPKTAKVDVKRHGSPTKKSYESMTVAELKKLIPADKIVSSRPGKPPLKADIIASIKKNLKEPSPTKSKSTSSGSTRKSKSKKSSKSNDSKSRESKSSESSSKSIKTNTKKSKSPKKSVSPKNGMVVMIWTKEAYEYNPDVGGQSHVYYSDTPYVHSGAPKELSASIDALLKIVRYHLKSRGEKTEYSDEDIIHSVISNPSIQLYFSDNLRYFEAMNAMHL